MDADRITSNIYLGGVPRTCGPFDVVVLAAKELQNIPLKCQVLHAPLTDATPTRDEVKTALEAARAVHRLRPNKKVLVTCAEGINRSAFIVALALMMDHLSANQAIWRIQTRRKGTRVPPLSNEAFVRILRQYEKARR